MRPERCPRLVASLVVRYAVIALVLVAPVSLAQEGSGPRITLHYIDTAASGIIASVVKEYQVPIAGFEGLTQRIAVNVDNMPLEEALTTILTPLGYQWAKADSGYRVFPAGQAGPAPSPVQVSFQEGLVTLSARDADVRQVLSELARATGENIVPDPSVIGQVTLELHGVTLTDCLDALTRLIGPYQFTRKGSIWFIERAEPTARRPVVEVENGLVSLSAEQVEIGEVLSALAEAAQISLIASEDVRGKITARLQGVPVEDAVDIVAKAGSYVATRTAGAYLVTRTGVGTYVQPRIEVTAAGAPGVPVKPLVSVNALQGSLDQILDQIGKQTGTQIVVLGSLQEPVTTRLTNVPVEEALKTLLQGSRLSLVRDSAGRYLVVDTSANSPYFARAAKTEVIEPRYLDASDLPQLLSSAVSSMNYRVLPDRNALAVTGDEEVIRRVKEEVAKLDEPAPLVMIEAVVVETSTSVTEKLGAVTSWKDRKIAVGVPGVGDITYSTIGDLGRGFMTVLTALIDQGRGRIIANPRVATLSGRQATISIGEQRYFKILTFPYVPPEGTTPVPIQQVQAISAGIELRITPTVGAADDILLNVSPEVSSITGLTAEGLPEISRRRAETALQVKSGEIVVIGGLKQREKSESRRKVPLLGDIPLLGELFKSRSEIQRESELIIVITCTVYRGGQRL